MRGKLIVVRGTGDLATGVIVRLFKAGYSIVALDIEKPTSIRRTVSLSEAVYDGEATVEGVTAKRAASVSHALRLAEEGFVPVLKDPAGKTIPKIKPDALVDAIIAKKNLGTRIDSAPFVVALGPGFTAGVDCHAVIETKRGHYLGSVITEGSAAPNTGIPGIIAGVGSERVQRAPAEGVFSSEKKIGDIVKKGDKIGEVAGVPMIATIDGCLRGLLRTGIEVTPGYKCGDIDPRSDAAFCFSVSDKARAVAGGVLEALDGYFSSKA